MAGIVEIWRRDNGLHIPVKFTVDSAPELITVNEEGQAVLVPIGAGDGEPTDLIVSDIEFRETGAMAGKRMSEPCYCISFANSPVQRIIPEREVIDVCYVKKD